MSKETLETLNTTTLIGHTDARGTAWHYRADLQGVEPNHYPGADPRPGHREAAVLLGRPGPADRRGAARGPDDDDPPRRHRSPRPLGPGPRPGRDRPLRPGRRPRHGRVHRRLHPAPVRRVAADDRRQHPRRRPLHLLRRPPAGRGDRLGRGQRVPESITTPEGVVFRPNLLATTTFDGSLATTYKRTVTDVVCDNTREAALGEDGQEIRVKHTRNSSVKLTNARQALALVHTTADAFAAEVARLCRIRVDRPTWSRFLQQWVPLHDTQGERLTGKAATLAVRKREVLDSMFCDDPRVTPWAGTAHAVLQAVNTYEHHAKPVRGTSRGERNMLRTITGDFAGVDHAAWTALQEVLATA